MRLCAILFLAMAMTVASFAESSAGSGELRGAWRVLTIDGAPPGGRAGVSLHFEPDGRLFGQGPCNRYHAGYRIEGDKVLFSSGATTRMFCGEEIMRAEQRFMAALGGGAVWRVAGDSLTLAAENGAMITAIRSRAR